MEVVSAKFEIVGVKECSNNKFILLSENPSEVSISPHTDFCERPDSSKSKVGSGEPRNLMLKVESPTSGLLKDNEISVIGSQIETYAKYPTASPFGRKTSSISHSNRSARTAQN